MNQGDGGVCGVQVCLSVWRSEVSTGYLSLLLPLFFVEIESLAEPATPQLISLAGQRLPGTPLSAPAPQHLGYRFMLHFCLGAWELNSGSHACTVSTPSN